MASHSGTQSSTVVSAVVLRILKQGSAPSCRPRPAPVDEVDLADFKEPKYRVNGTASPNNPVITEDQVRFLNALHGFGIPGLVQELIDWSNERWSTTNHPEKGKCWDVIADDGDEGNLYAYLLQLPKDILEYLIKGILPHMIKTNSAVNQFYTHNMIPQVERCGSYAKQCCDADTGDWLPPNTLADFVKDARRYAQGLTSDDAWAAVFDDTFNKATRRSTLTAKPPLGFRHYADTQAKKDNMVFLADGIQQELIDKVTASDHGSAHSRVPIEVGWASDIKKRLKDNIRNYLTAENLGFFRAWTRKKHQDGELQPIEFLQMQLFVALSDSDRDVAGMTESVAAALFGALVWQLGWNSIPPNITQFSVSSSAFASALRFATSPRIIKNAEADVVNSIKLFDELAALETEYASLAPLKAERERLIAELADLKQEVDEQEDDIRACKNEFHVARADRKIRLSQLPTSTRADLEEERDALLARTQPAWDVTLPERLTSFGPWKPELFPGLEEIFAEKMEALRHARAQTVYATTADEVPASFSQTTYTPHLDTQDSQPSSPTDEDSGTTDEPADHGTDHGSDDADSSTLAGLIEDFKELDVQFAATQKLLAMKKLPMLTNTRAPVPLWDSTSSIERVRLRALRRMHRRNMARRVERLRAQGDFSAKIGMSEDDESDDGGLF